MSKPAIPEVVRISGRIWKVERRKMDSLYGTADNSLGLLTISTEHDEFSTKDTVLHEVMHAILRQQGRLYSEEEELFVGALATGITGVLADNPKLAKYLLT